MELNAIFFSSSRQTVGFFIYFETECAFDASARDIIEKFEIK